MSRSLVVTVRVEIITIGSAVTINATFIKRNLNPSMILSYLNYQCIGKYLLSGFNFDCSFFILSEMKIYPVKSRRGYEVTFNWVNNVKP